MNMVLDRFFGGAKEPFLLFFAIFYPGNEELFKDYSKFREFFEDPAFTEMKNQMNRRLRFKLVRKTVAEQAKLKLDEEF